MMNDESPTDGLLPHERYARAGHWWIEGAIIVAFWSTLAGLDVAQSAFDPRGGGQGGMHPGESLYTFLEYALWIVATPVIFWLARRFSFERRGWPGHLLLHVGAAVAVSAAVDLAHHVLWNALMTGRPRPVSLAAVLGGFHFLPELLLYLIVLAAGFARDYFLRYRGRVDEAARLQAEAAEQRARTVGLQAQLAESRLRALRAQLNPHFLFNTLNFISSDLERDPRGVRRMIARLSELLRYTLDKTDVREVPLRQELGFIDGYLEIQRIRFEDRLAVHHNVDPAVLDALVPNLILQPLVENAVKHGIAHRESGGGIELRAWRVGEHLHLSVRDDGPGLPPTNGDGDGDGEATASQGIGLRNTRERLEALYGTAQRFVLEPAEGGGLTAHLVLPYHTGTDLYTTALPE
ncbi:MAG: sensor histidine kinase [Rhodothermales bacterium]